MALLVFAFFRFNVVLCTIVFHSVDFITTFPRIFASLPFPQVVQNLHYSPTLPLLFAQKCRTKTHKNRRLAHTLQP